MNKQESDILPTHLGFIVDGNRRWAKERGLPTLEGHRRGLNVVEKIAEECFDNGVKYATFFIFSTENWERTKEEVGYLMNLARGAIMRLAKKMKKENIRLVLLGAREGVDEDILELLDKGEALTAECTKGTMAVCFNYGGYREIVDAVRKIDGEVTEEAISANLYHPEIPNVDMIVRTSGEERISGFMLWRAAYAEMLFLDKYWPEMTREDIEEILAEYASRNRRFGK
jgi:undecaprenyl diphosphate synthase